MESKEVKNWRSDAALDRYRMIMPLLDPEIDNAKRCMLREKIASREGISVRTVYRYEKGYREGRFEGLIPKEREKRRSQKLPDNWDEIVREAVQLKKEVPRRSVRQIILILESEEYAAPGVIKQSTLQRYLCESAQALCGRLPARFEEVLQGTQAGAFPGGYQVWAGHQGQIRKKDTDIPVVGDR